MWLAKHGTSLSFLSEISTITVTSPWEVSNRLVGGQVKFRSYRSHFQMNAFARKVHVSGIEFLREFCLQNLPVVPFGTSSRALKNRGKMRSPVLRFLLGHSKINNEISRQGYV